MKRLIEILLIEKLNEIQIDHDTLLYQQLHQQLLHQIIIHNITSLFLHYCVYALNKATNNILQKKNQTSSCFMLFVYSYTHFCSRTSMRRSITQRSRNYRSPSKNNRCRFMDLGHSCVVCLKIYDKLFYLW